MFLDEVGEMPLSLQPKLLRVLEERTVLPVGSTIAVKVSVRIIAATNRDLKSEVEAEQFRDDLYYRLNAFEMAIPPLRNRLEDLPELAEHLIARHNAEMKTNYKGVNNAALRVLMSLPWKGNIRELDNVLERAMILGNGEWVSPADLPGISTETASLSEDNLEIAIQLYEKNLIERTLAKTGGDKIRAARTLGTEPVYPLSQNRKALYRRMIYASPVLRWPNGGRWFGYLNSHPTGHFRESVQGQVNRAELYCAVGFNIRWYTARWAESF